MLNWIVKNRKKLLISTLLVTGAVIFVFTLWLIQLSEKIQQSLKEKTFLPPTQFYSAEETFSEGMILTSKDFESILGQRQYFLKPTDSRLRKGDYQILSSDECRKLLPQITVETQETCLIYSLKETDDPTIKEIKNQVIVFDANKLIKKTYHVEQELVERPVILEPQLFAQYLQKEPVQQNYLPLGEMPVSCLNAVLAIEDKNFLEHSGVSYTGILRAVFRNLTGTKYSQGGSTITQQLVKNYFLNSERTLKRKFIEFFMSLILENHSSKDEILETYLNVIYLGQNGPFQVRGYPAASEFYFEKPIQSLETHECALLAAVLNSPGLYNPLRKPENSLKRRNLVLDKMKEANFISEEQSTLAKEKPLPTKNLVNVSETAPYYIDAVQKELAKTGLSADGLKIYTGLNLKAQLAAQNSVRSQLSRLEAENKVVKKIKESGQSLEAVLISVNNETGIVESIVGGRGFRLTQFNRAIQGHRQVGSIMKPFVFLTALKENMSPTKTLSDTRFHIEYEKQKWSPENYGGKYFGEVPMYFALKNSLNCATAQLGMQVGLDKIIETARAAGIESDLQKVPSITLGSFELYPFEVLNSYLTFSQFGKRKNLRLIRSIVNQYGGIVYQSEDSSTEAIDSIATAQLVSMMKQTVLSGSARSIPMNGFNHPAAGKTGTTSDNKDSWFAGFTPQITTVVWVGYDDNTSHGLTGASGAVPIWTEYMKNRHQYLPKVDFQWPSGADLKKYNYPTDEVSPEVELLFRENQFN